MRVRHPTLHLDGDAAIRVYQAEDHLPCVALYPRGTDAHGAPAILITIEARSLVQALAQRRDARLMCVGGVLVVAVEGDGFRLSVEWASAPAWASSRYEVLVPADKVDRLKEMVLACGVEEGAPPV